jgi:uncharacterized protein YPO0396
VADDSNIIDETIERTGPAMKRITLLLITLLAFQQVLITPIPAQVYKYVDKNGVPHYTNTPNDPRYMKSKIRGTDPKKKNRPTIKKSSKYKKPPTTTKSSAAPRPY